MSLQVSHERRVLRMGERVAPSQHTRHELVISQPNLQALRRQVHELQGRNKELNAFARTVAHDLKSPLGTMVCLASVLHEELGELSVEEQHKHLGDLVRVARKMSNIVDELLLLAEVSDAEVVIHPLDMATVVASAQERLAHMIQDYQAEIILPAAWPAAEGYEPWIEEVWVNYLSNAIKYGGTPPRIELDSEVQADGMVRFWVHDNGAGIAPAAQAQLFKPFTRLSSIRARGHGLGLSVVLDIVTKLGGQVGVDSAPGQGTTFSFTLLGASQGAPIQNNHMR
jgi:two-component system sensor histidine kinase/response regulator